MHAFTPYLALETSSREGTKDRRLQDSHDSQIECEEQYSGGAGNKKVRDHVWPHLESMKLNGTIIRNEESLGPFIRKVRFHSTTVPWSRLASVRTPSAASAAVAACESTVTRRRSPPSCRLRRWPDPSPSP